METIYKLQPHRTMHLQGFDAYGAAAALWGAAESGFSLSGVFRDQADFAVLVLYDRDDKFGHPRFSYLPDERFTGMTLDFDISFVGVHPFESKKWPWTDWKTLNAYLGAGELARKNLIELATGPTGRTGAAGKFVLNGAYLMPGDRVVLWYQNRAFDSSVISSTSSCVQAIFWSTSGQSSCEQDIWWQPASPSCEQDIYWSSVNGSCEQDISVEATTTSCEQDMWWQSVALSTEHDVWWQPVSLSVQQAFWWQGNAAYRHSVWIAGQQYYCDENGWNSSQIANNIREQVVARDPNVNVTQQSNVLIFALKPGVPGPISISSSDGSAPGTLNDYLHAVRIGPTQYSCLQGSLTSAQIASNIASQITASDPTCTATVGGSQGNGVIVALRSGQSGPVIVTDLDGGGPTTLQDYQHWVQVGSNRYGQYQGGLSAAEIATAIAGAIAAGDPACTATASNNAITVSLRSGQVGPVAVSSSDGSGPVTLSGSSGASHWVQCGANRYSCQQGSLTAAQIASNIASQIAASDPSCTATANGNAIVVSLRTGVLGPMSISSSDGSTTVTLAGANHWVKIGNTTYTCSQGSLTAAQIAQNLVDQINGSDPNCSATVNSSAITITLRSGVNGPISVSSSDGYGAATLNGATHWVKLGTNTYTCDQGSLTAGQIASNIAGQISANDPQCTATAADNAITISLRAGQVGPVDVSSSDGSAGLTLNGAAHSVTIGSATYSCDQGSEPDSASIASNIAAQIEAGDTNCTATASGTAGNEITITLRTGIVGPVSVSSSDGSAPATLRAVTAAMVCTALANQINQTDWAANGPVAISAVSGTDSETGHDCITITAEPGVDGNSVTFYELHHNDRLYFTPGHVRLAGGSSNNVTWHVSIDFSALGWTDIRKLWLTFAPILDNGAEYVPSEWSVTVTNWTVTDLSGVRALKVAGPGSVRMEEDNPWVVRSGFWEAAPTDGFAFWSRGRAIRAAASGASLTIETHCQHTHDVYVGTRMDSNCGVVSAQLDGVPTDAPLDCFTDTYSATQVRRKLFGNVTPGTHSVEITLTGGKNELSGGWYFYFDFLECAVAADVPDAPETRSDVGVATDFDTDSTYKLSPQRLIWNLQKLGLVGEIDHYCGVFWWKQAVRSGGSFSHATVTFGGTFVDQDEVWVHIGDTAIGKTVFPDDTTSTIAAHLAYFINATLVGIWAAAVGPVLTITIRSWLPNWSYTFLPETGSLAGTISHSGDLASGSSVGAWIIDSAADPVFNRAFRDWHADYFAALAAAGIGVVASFSQELVAPPENPPGAVWIQRWWDQSPVSTATGFGTLESAQCAFSEPVLNYMQRAFAAMAGLMAGAGLLPRLQFGETLWWYQANASGMAFYDADTKAAAWTALGGRSLAHFYTVNDDPGLNGYADANFLRGRLKSYVDAIRAFVLASYPAAQFELLFPLDVNDPDIRRLNRYVNVPSEWEARATSGFDTILMEGFEYGGVDHDLDRAARCAAYPFAELAWDVAHCRYLMGLYYSGWPWQREYLAAKRTGVPVLKIWAYDHLGLFGWPLPLPKVPASPVIF